MTTAKDRQARYRALRQHGQARSERRSRAFVAATLVLVVVTVGGLAWTVDRINAQARAVIGVARSFPGPHDGVCDAEDSSPEWFADNDCADPAVPAMVPAVCVGSTGTGHDCLINTLTVRPCARWDGSGTAHPCAWNSQARGVGNCPALSGLSVGQCRLIAAGRVYVYVA